MRMRGLCVKMLRACSKNVGFNCDLLQDFKMRIRDLDVKMLKVYGEIVVSSCEELRMRICDLHVEIRRVCSEIVESSWYHVLVCICAIDI